jgi:hypothetical protein
MPELAGSFSPQCFRHMSAPDKFNSIYVYNSGFPENLNRRIPMYHYFNYEMDENESLLRAAPVLFEAVWKAIARLQKLSESVNSYKRADLLQEEIEPIRDLLYRALMYADSCQTHIPLDDEVSIRSTLLQRGLLDKLGRPNWELFDDEFLTAYIADASEASTAHRAYFQNNIRAMYSFREKPDQAEEQE